MPNFYHWLLRLLIVTSGLVLDGCSATPKNQPNDFPLSSEHWSLKLPSKSGALQLQGTFTHSGIVLLSIGAHIPQAMLKSRSPWALPASLRFLFDDQHCTGQHELSIVQKDGDAHYSHYFKQRITWGEEFNLLITWKNSSATIQLNDEILTLNNIAPITGAILSNEDSAMQVRSAAYLPQ